MRMRKKEGVAVSRVTKDYQYPNWYLWKARVHVSSTW